MSQIQLVSPKRSFTGGEWWWWWCWWWWRWWRGALGEERGESGFYALGCLPASLPDASMEKKKKKRGQDRMALSLTIGLRGDKADIMVMSI